jgi:hypothetical protein
LASEDENNIGRRGDIILGDLEVENLMMNGMPSTSVTLSSVYVLDFGLT